MDIKPPFADSGLLLNQGRKLADTTGTKADTSGTKADAAALHKTCQQFEAIFTQQLLKGMRATVPAGELLQADRSVEVFQDLMDRQVAEEMARSQGLGIADALLRQLQDDPPD